MRTKYGVVWREDSGAVTAGKAEFLPNELQLEGLYRRMPRIRTVAYTDIAGIRRMTRGEVTVDGRPTVILELRSGERLAIASAVTGRLVGELIARLTRCRECAAPAR
jgi:hypothetical protein